MAWAFYGHRLNLYRRTIPHEGFKRLMALGSSRQFGYFVFTSNVDGQFQKAGFSEARIEECHGSIRHLQCLEPCGDEIWEAPLEDIVVDEAAFQAAKPLPACLRCGGMARPNILMFGDWNWNARRSEAQHARLAEWIGRIRARKGRLAVIELGAGTAVPTVRHFSEVVAERFNATLIRINPRESDVPVGQIGLALGAADGVARLVGAL
jgi:NAD-dependent SIR2 family protein deacetylase